MCLCASGGYAYSISQVLEGVESLCLAEMGLPRFIWVQRVDADLGGGYDLANRQVVIGASVDAQVFDALHINSSFQVFTDFSSSTKFLFNMGLTYRFSDLQSSSNKAFIEARKETMLRKIKTCELYYDYLKRRNALENADGSNTVASVRNRLEQIELAYLLIQIQTLSGLSEGEPEPVDTKTLPFSPLRDEDVKTALLNYGMVMQKDLQQSASLYLKLQTVSERDFGYAVAGPGIHYEPQNASANNLEDRMQEVSMRKMVLEHEVLWEILPELRQQIAETTTERNKLSRSYILGQTEVSALEDINRTLADLEALDYNACMDILKIEALFRVLRGEW